MNYTTGYQPVTRYGGSSHSSQANYQTNGSGYSAAQPYVSNNEHKESPAHAPEQPDMFFHESPESFLEQTAPALPVVQETSMILPLVEQTFQLLTDEALPKNLRIHILDELSLRTFHATIGGTWSPGIQGFSLNKHGVGVSEIYVKQAPLDNVMLTIGHEIGHVLSPSLVHSAEEEAKAFAFSMAWVNTIREHNIGNIAGSFREHPAQNGVHDIGFAWASQLVQKGKTAAQAFMSIVLRTVRMHEQQETILV